MCMCYLLCLGNSDIFKGVIDSLVMEEYISKAALVAEINQRIEDYKSHKIDDSYHDGLIFALEDLRDDFINIFEVKEVDLNEEIEKCLKRHSMLAVGKKDFTDIAKHFFEFGLKAQKGE